MPRPFQTIFYLLVLMTFTIQLLAGQKIYSSFTKTDEIEVDGIKRDFLYYVPTTNLTDKPALILVLHGATETPDKIETATGYRFNELADQDGTVIVYPAGINCWWNFGSPNLDPKYKNIDDVKFFSALIDHCVSRFHVDRRKVYVTGMSAGAIMSVRLACELADKITAVASVAGSNPLRFPMNCSAKFPVSLLFINGDQDNLVPFNGGLAHMHGISYEAFTDPVPASVQAWASLAGCAGLPVTINLPVKEPKDPTRIQQVTYPLSPQGIEVQLYVVHGGGHRWPSGVNYSHTDELFGKMSDQIDATQLIWNFFKRHTR